MSPAPSCCCIEPLWDTLYLSLTMSRVFALLFDGEQDDWVGDDDDEEREDVGHDHSQGDVDSLPVGAGERVVRDALDVVGEVRVILHVEHIDLQ